MSAPQDMEAAIARYWKLRASCDVLGAAQTASVLGIGPCADEYHIAAARAVPQAEAELAALAPIVEPELKRRELEKRYRTLLRSALGEPRDVTPDRWIDVLTMTQDEVSAAGCEADYMTALRGLHGMSAHGRRNIIEAARRLHDRADGGGRAIEELADRAVREQNPHDLVTLLAFECQHCGRVYLGATNLLARNHTPRGPQRDMATGDWTL